MELFGKLTVLVGLGLVLNLATQIESHFLSCNVEHLKNTPQCSLTNGIQYFRSSLDSRAFFECKNGQVKCLQCPYGTVWDQTYSFCNDKRERVIVSKNDDLEESTTETPLPTDPPRTTISPTTEEAEYTTEPQPETTPEPEVTTGSTELGSEPTTELLETTTGQVSTDPAPETTTHQPPTTDLATESPSEAPTTQGTTKPTTTGPTTSSRSPALCPVDDPMPPPEACPPEEQVPTYMPYPYDCRKYFQCSNGAAVCMRCPAGTTWDQENTICGREGSVGCNIVTTTVNPLYANHHQQNRDIITFLKKFNFPKIE